MTVFHSRSSKEPRACCPHPRVSVGLVGNPNSGKTTIFNQLCRTKEHVGNYPRVTVEIAEWSFEVQQQSFQLADLPGLYALTTQTPEESEARDYIHAEKADILVNVLDAGNLERSLFLTSQLVELGTPIIFVLNMIDEAERKQLTIDTEALAGLLGGPVLTANGVTGQGLDGLKNTLLHMAQHPHRPTPEIHHYDDHLAAAIERVQGRIRQLHPEKMDARQTRWLAIKLLEGDEALLRREGDHAHLLEMVRRERYDLAKEHDGECEMLFADARYGFVHNLILKTVQQSPEMVGHKDVTRKLDNLFLHPIVGIPVFFGLLWVMFHSTFTLGEYPMNWIEALVEWTKGGVGELIPDGMVHDLVIDGVIAGVGGTIIFLPNIVILFFFMAIFSETGYLTRAAFLMDRLMHSFGLHGKALIPMVIGFGCNVPAIMATRTIESKRSRLITILINPFMLCAARLPVFILFAGAFFSDMAATIVFLMYIISILMAMVGSILLNKLLPQTIHESFIMELPPYRLPTLRALLIHMWDNAMAFLQKIAGVILIGSIVLWFMKEFPKTVEWSVDYQGQIEYLKKQPYSEQHQESIAKLVNQQKQESLEKSYLGRVAHTVAPVFAPLEMTWRDTVAILTGLVAKEVVVASYAVLYSQGDHVSAESSSFQDILGKTMRPLVAFAFMVFTLLYSPCLATIATIRREAGGWKWAGFSVAFSMTYAWLVAFLIVTIGNLIV
ncbi:MAG: ferrous iron transport protein B [Magnetococcales bacterium]|nr:ferrous iron transport protein B [Magnetococcales bacterium]